MFLAKFSKHFEKHTLENWIINNQKLSQCFTYLQTPVKCHNTKRASKKFGYCFNNKKVWSRSSKLIGKVIFHDSRTLKSKLNLSQSLKFQAELGTIVLRYFRQRLSRSFCLHWMHFPNDEWWGNMDWRIQCFAYLCESTAKNLKSSFLPTKDKSAFQLPY